MVRAHSFCECDDDQKIPEVELIYVLDQRSRQDGSEGKYQMGGKDNKDIENMIEEEHGEKVKSDKKLKKTEASEKLKVKEKKRVSGEQVVTHKDLNRVLGDSDLDTENNPEIDNSNDEDFNPCKKVPYRQNRQDLRNLPMICDKYVFQF